ncbi:MAG: phasin family protein [Gammaproteobacteria bacterium]|nr:phasin family protein [Gammaproteobacteria bacterium]
MAKKKTVSKSAASSKKSVLSSVDPLVEYGRDVWLAGLGAMSLAQQETNKIGGKALEKGSKLFDQLVKEGSKLEKSTRKNVDTTADDIRGGIEQRVDRVRQTAANNWDKLETVFEDRVARALGRLGVPTADEIQELINEVNHLSREVRELNKQVKGSAVSTSKTAAPKTAQKTAQKTAKKTTSKAA